MTTQEESAVDLPTLDTLAPSVAQRVIDAGKRFEAAWRAGQKPNIQEYLGDTKEPERSVLLRHLLAVEWICLRTKGEALSLDSYVRRFPEHQELILSLSQEIQDQSQTASTIGFSSSPSSATGAGPIVSTPSSWPTIPGYEIVQELGHGGMGIVYKARQVKLRRLVALKVMMPELASNPTARKRFKREAEAMAAIEHDHVVSIFQVGEENGLPFLAMQFLEGETLQECLKREQKLPCPEVVRLGREMAEGLSAAHGAGLVHRDIKPGNIWLERVTSPQWSMASKGSISDQQILPGPSLTTGHWSLATRVKILDFGLARAADQNTLLSEPGALMGTPQYMSPEQAQGEELDARSDLFSLGAVLYRMAGGDLPFQATTVVALLMAIVQEPPKPLHRDVPKELADLIMQCLEKEPAKRPASAQEVADALQRMEQGLPSVPRERGKKPRRRLRLAVASGVLVLAIALALFFFLPGASGKVRVESDDPAIEIVFDKTGPILNAGDSETISLPVGEHAVLVKGTDFKVDLEPLTIQSGQTITLKVILAQRQIQLLDGDTVIASRDIPMPAKFTNKLGMEFAIVPKGTSWLGGGGGKVGDRKLIVPHDFYLGAYEVTQAEWQAVMDNNPSHFSRTGEGKNTILEISDSDLRRFPVENVTWHECQDFISRLNKKLRETGWVYRLPTDAEWEYACRGGPVQERNQLGFDFYLDEPANVLPPEKCNSSEALLSRPCMVGSYVPNRLGLFDMHGNVREWCEDAMQGKDPAFRVGRGGQWSTSLQFCKAAARYEHDPATRSDGMGLRLARVPTGKGPVPPPVEDKVVYPREFEAHPGGVRSVAFSKDGKQAISCGNDGLIRVSEIASSKQPMILKGHAGDVLSLAVHPDGKHLISGGGDRTIRVWDLASGKYLRQFQGVTHPCWGLSISPDGARVAGGSEEKGFRLWDFAGGKLIASFEGYWANTVAFAPGETQVLAGGQDGKPRLWDVKEKKVVRTFPGHRAWIRGAGFSGDGTLAVTCSGNSPHDLQPGDDFSIRLWDVAKGQEIFSFLGHQHRVFAAALSRDGRWIFSGSYDKTLRLWDVEKRTEQHRCIANAPVASAALSPDASLGLSGDDSGKVQLWRLPTELRPAPAGLKPGKLLTDVDFLDPEKNPFPVSKQEDKTLHRFELASGRYIMHFPTAEKYWIGWSPPGQYRNFILQATGMVSEKKSLWGVYINGTPASLTFRVMIGRDGHVELSRTPWGKAFTVPKVAPMKAEDYRPDRFNTLTVARRDRELTIFVNAGRSPSQLCWNKTWATAATASWQNNLPRKTCARSSNACPSGTCRRQAKRNRPEGFQGRRGEKCIHSVALVTWHDDDSICRRCDNANLAGWPTIASETLPFGHSAATHSAVKQTRKPIWALRPPGSSLPRQAERQRRGRSNQEPPRSTRNRPSSGPCGSVTSFFGYAPSLCRSWHHCHTLPCISCSPQALAGNVPTGVVFFLKTPFFPSP